MNVPNRNRIVLALVLASSLALAGGYWWGRSAGRASMQAHAGAVATPSAQRKVLYWYDPMKPEQHFDKPGKSPFMDMELVPKYASAGASTGTPAGEAGIVVSPQARQALGIRTVAVRRGALQDGVDVPGTLAWDQRNERAVSLPVDAVVSRLYVKAPYARVRAGEPLLAVLAPAWSSAIAEARALSGAKSDAGRGLRQAADARLRVLGVPAGATVDGSGAIVMRAPIAGVASEIAVREGQSVGAGSLLVRVVDDRTLWLQAALPQSLAGGIRAGTPVGATVAGFPGRTFAGRVERVLPQVDPQTRAQDARIVIDNAERLLAPGMFAQVRLAPERDEHWLVPSEALILGDGPARVIVEGADGGLRAVAVQPGRSAGGVTEILAGLEGGERVVASGQFLIDSEASLSGALDRLQAPPPADGAGGEDAP